MNIYKVLVVCLMSVQPQQFFSGPNDTKLVFLQILAESEFYRARRLIALKSKPINLFVAVSKLSLQLHEIVIAIVDSSPKLSMIRMNCIESTMIVV